MTKVVDLFNAKRPVEQAPKIHHDMERAVEQLQGQLPDMIGFVMVAIAVDGRSSVRSSIRSKDHFMGDRMLAGLAVERIREELVTDKTICWRLGMDEE